MDKFLTTADVPPQFLADTFLLGHIPYKALTSDPRISYSLYIPPTHYNPDPSKPSNKKPKIPFLIFIHGTRRDIFPIYTSLKTFAEETPCAVLAPLFPMGIEGPNDLDSYKVLRSGSGTLRADEALLDMIQEVGERWVGVETEKVFLMGFSGGGQFVHRFLYLYPERLAAASVGAPGRATHLDPNKAWPEGISDVSSLFKGRAINKSLIAKVPIQVIIGSEDNKIHGGEEFWAWVRKIKGAKKGGELQDMTKGRKETLEELRKSWKQDGIESQLDVVEGAAHEVDKVRSTVLAFLQPLMRKCAHRENE